MDKNYLKGVFSANKEISKVLESPQFDLSEQILEFEMSNGLTQQETADLAGIDLSSFLEIEFGSTDYSLDFYKKVINRLLESK